MSDLQSGTGVRHGEGMVLIPAYQEAGRVGRVVRDVRNFMSWIVVVDDGSRDHTAQEAQEAGAIVRVHPDNQGKGAALRTGFRYAQQQQAEFVLTMDGDGQHAASDIPAFISMYETGMHDVIVGNRAGSTHSMPFVRRMTNRVMSAMLSQKMGQWVPDTQNGFRLYRTSMIPDVEAYARGFAADSELLLELSRQGSKIGSVPVQSIYGDEQSKIRPLRDTFRFLRMLVMFDRRCAAAKLGTCSINERGKAWRFC